MKNTENTCKILKNEKNYTGKYKSCLEALGLWPWCSYATDNASLKETGIVISLHSPKV